MVLGYRSGRAGRTVFLSGAGWGPNTRHPVLMTDSAEADQRQPDSPRKRGFRGSSTQIWTAVIGLILMALTLFWNSWVIQAKNVFANFQLVNAVFDQVDYTDLVLTYDICHQAEKDLSSADVARIMRLGRSLQKHQALFLYARGGATELINTFTLEQLKFSVGSLFRKKPEIPQKQLLMPIAKDNPSAKEFCESISAGRGDLASRTKIWQASLTDFSSLLEISAASLMLSGVGPGSNEVLVQKLNSRLSVVTRWWLPILNGALGAIIYCLNLMINNDPKEPRFGEVLLRTVFGGFVGLLVATLIIPSAIVSPVYASGAAGASLLAFIFGFAQNSFISMLERLNKLVVESTQRKPKS